MKLKGLPNDLPQYVEVDISKLDLGQGVKVEDIDIPNIEKLDVKSSVLIWIKPTRQAK
jgi:large subunit ribosomal protein L25